MSHGSFHVALTSRVLRDRMQRLASVFFCTGGEHQVKVLFTQLDAAGAKVTGTAGQDGTCTNSLLKTMPLNSTCILLGPG